MRSRLSTRALAARTEDTSDALHPACPSGTALCSISFLNYKMGCGQEDPIKLCPEAPHGV